MPRLDASRWRNPAVFLANGFGDRLMALPTLRALASLFEGRLRLLGTTGDVEAFYGGLPLRAAHEIAVEKCEGGWTFDAAEAAAALGACDLFLSLNPWHTAALDALLAALGAELTIGYAPAFDIHVARDGARHVVDDTFAMVRLFDEHATIDEGLAAPPLLPAPARNVAQRALAQIPDGVRVVAVHTETDGPKMWPAAVMAAILDEFLAHRTDFVALVVDKHDRGIDIGARGSAVVPLRLPLTAAMAIVSRSQLFFGVDSCMLHVADFFGVPGVGMFGPTDPARFGFRFTPGEHVRAGREIGAAEAKRIGGMLARLADERVR